MKQKKKLNVVGIMSGTSLDGVDFVLTSLGGPKPAYKDMASVSFPKPMREALFQVSENKVNFRQVQRLHFDLGKFYEASLTKILKKKKWKIDLIGIHGQTVFHEAGKATVQIGEPSFLKKFNTPVISDFRSKIVGAGGEGAPLAPIFHKELMGTKSNWAFLNLGGMSNISLFQDSKFLATDLGPANVFVDLGAKYFFDKDFDKGGKESRKGLPDFKVVKNFLKKNSFLNKRLPKSCGREDFSELEFKKLVKKMKHLSPQDSMATLSEITLFPIFDFLRTKKIDRLIAAGGGVKNLYFMKRLRELFPDLDIETSEALGWPSQAIEAGAFAHLAFLKVHQKSVDLSYMGFKKPLSPLGRMD